MSVPLIMEVVVKSVSTSQDHLNANVMMAMCLPMTRNLAKVSDQMTLFAGVQNKSELEAL